MILRALNTLRNIIKENGAALVGVELKHKEDYEQLITRFKENNIQFMELNKIHLV